MGGGSVEKDPSILDCTNATIYSYTMTKREKLLAKARHIPNSLTFDEFELLLEQSGWEFKRQNGSHRIWLSPHKQVLPIQPDNGKAKGYQVKQALIMMENNNG